MKRCITTLISSLLLAFVLQAQNEVTVHINSGNPRFPFPQFLAYEYGTSHHLENLGTVNPEGVVHAEMEQDIRDAYQIFANEWTYTGDQLNGVKYIRGNLGCPYDCREGDGYSLLAAAIMGDKTSFDGLWMCVHDKSRVKQYRYIDGAMFQPNYAYGDYSIKDNQDAATDGDVDIALALYVAWMQWGDYMGINDARGNPISYKKELMDVLKGFIHLQTRFPNDGEPRRYLSGEIGLDGYLKNGNTWAEATNYVSQNPMTVDGVRMTPEFAGPCNVHTDYLAPAYFHEFYELLEKENPSDVSEFEKNQFKRCAASCDWMVGNWISQNAKNIFVGEEATVNGTSVTMHAGNQGGRFRSVWRTALNYVWHGNPTYTWNPSTHTVSETSNTYEHDGAVRYSNFMNDPQGWDHANCTKFGGGPKVTYKGPATLHWDIEPDGSFPSSEFIFNWIAGCGTMSAISAEDLELLGVLYRTCNIEWDITTGGDGYLSSVPHYFHGWFRLLGMLTATGNHIAPAKMIAQPNMKIYRALKDSLSFAYTGDTFTYLLDYRNYGSVDAQNVTIVEHVPDDFIFVSAERGGVYDAATHTVTWNIGTVPGFKTGSLDVTKGQVSYVAKVGPKAFGRYCTTAEISCSNGLGWTSNEYPNYVTATMQRNCVDVIKRSLIIDKEANLEETNPNQLVTYTINFENSSEAGWLDGGRPRVNIAFSNGGLATQQEWLRFRLYNDAIEPYINYGNYRVSYYMYDAARKSLGDPGWGWYTAIYEGKRSSADAISVSHETVVEGEDAYGKWNQRMILQFAPLLVTTTGHLSNYYGMGSRIHRGGTEPLRVAGYIHPNPWVNTDFSDDWSWDAAAEGAEDGAYYPVTPSWQRINQTTGQSIETPVNEYIPSVCDVPTHTVSNILVEEYDGYVWRRILGTGPMAGRDMYNVVVRDTLPKGLTFVEFKNSCPLESFGATMTTSRTSDGRDIIIWRIPTMQIKQKGTIKYTALANFPSGRSCETSDEVIDNVAWIYADMNSPVGDTASITVTCAKVPEPIVPTTLTKTPSVDIVSVGDEITYTLEYEQTHGFVTNNAGQNASDWTVSGGSVSNGTVSVNANSNSNVKYNYSYSKNIFVEADCQFAQYAETYWYFRDNVRLYLKVDYGVLKVECYNGNTRIKAADLVASSGNLHLAVQVQGSILRMWASETASVDTSETAAFTAENISTTAGYFGFINNAHGNHKYSKIHVHTDNAYNLSIVDELPSDLTYVSSSNSGVKSGDNVTWTFEQGINNPIPFGKKYTVTVKATVNACNQKIINTAHVNLLGHDENEIRAQATVECGAGCPPKPTVSSPVTYCQGATATALTATGTALKWYTSETGGTAQNSITPSTSAAGTTTYYVSQTENDCESPRAAINVVVNPKPSTPTVTAPTAVCEGEAITLSAPLMQNATYKWTGPNSFTSTDREVTVTSSATTSHAGEYSVVVTSQYSCESDAGTATIAVNAVPDAPTVTSPIQYCKGETVSDEVTATGTSLKWYTSATGTTEFSSLVPSTSTVGSVHYYVSQSVDGCESERADLEVQTLAPPETPAITTNSPVCVGSKIELSTSADGTYTWTGPNNFTSTDQNPEIASATTAAAGEYTLVVKVGNCTSEAGTATVVVNEIPATPSPSNNGPKCAGEDITLSVSAVANATYSWTGPDNYSKTDQNPTTTVAGEYSVTVTVAGCTSEAGTTTVVVNAIPDAPTVTTPVQYCQNETVSAEVTAEGDNLSWYTTADGNVKYSSLVPTTATVGSVHYYVSQTVNGCESPRADLEVKTLEPPTKPVITSNSPICVGEALTLGTESEGTYTWSGPNSFTSTDKNPEIASVTADAAGEYSLVVKVGNCTSEAGTATVVVNAIPSVNIDAVANQCVDGNDVTLTVTATPAGGTGSFSGTGVSGSTFSPATAGAGMHEISYTYKVSGCSKTESINITVQDKPTVSFDLPTTACASGDVIALTGNQTGGTFTATPSLDLTSGFNPANATVGQEYAITYEYSDGVCSNSTSKNITVYNPQKPVGTDVAIVYTKVTTGNVPALTATGVNQIWYSDAQLTNRVGEGNSYTPEGSVVLDGGQGKIGTYTYYVVSTEEGCVSEATEVKLDISSCAVEAPTKSAASVDVCYGETDVDKRTINVITSAVGNVRWYDAQGNKLQDLPDLTYLPSETEVGHTTFYVAAFDAEQNCESPRTSILYNITKLPTVTFDLPEEVCEGSAEIDFAPLKSQADGVVISLWGDQGPETSFLPNKKGKFKFEYSYTDAHGCTNSVQKEIQVNELPDVTFNDVPNQCEYSDLVDLSYYAGPIGGTFSGSGVTTQNSFFLFNPAAVEAGSTSTITYTYTDGKNCTNSAQKTIQVIARPSVTFNDVPSLCVGGEKHDLSQYVTPTTGTFSGEYVDGTEFNPTTKGSHKVSYTVESDGCSTTVEKTIVVNELPVLALEMNAVACVNTGNVTPQLSPANGTFTIDGEVSTTINTDNLSVGNHTLEYVYTDPTTRCSNSISKPLEIRKIEKPTVTNKTVVIGSTDLTITAQGNGGTFEWTDQNGTKTTGASISHSDASYAGEWEYCVTESDGTCTSEPACMTFSVIWCPAQAPLVTVSGVYVNHNWADVLYTEICESDEVPTFHVTGIEDGATINWYDGSTGGYITTDSPEAYQNNALKGKPGEYSMSVSQTTTGENGCTSIPTSVIVKIYENPQIAITNDDVHFCDYDDKVQIEVSSDSDNGTFTYSGDFVEDNYFYPANATTIGMAISVTVNYVDSETRCEATTSADFFVHHANKLDVVSPITQLESDYETVLTATPDGANKVTWYDACETKTKLKEGTSFSTGLVGEVSEDFGVTQTDPYGCESECATIQVNRIKCPTPAPTVTVETNTICATDEVPTFYVSGETDATFSWYENGTLISNDAEFTPTSIQCTAGSYSWTVTQTTTGTNGCEGVAAPATLKINPSPEIAVTIDDVLCMNEGIKTPKSNLQGTIFKFAGEVVTQINPEEYLAGTYDLTYSYNDPVTGCHAVEPATNCYDESCLKKTIEIREIPDVYVNNITQLVTSNEFKVSIISGHGGAYTWTDEHNTIVGVGATIEHQYEKEVGSWTYCVTESDGICSSNPACLTYSIINCPVPAPTIVEDNINGCTNEDAPEFLAEGDYEIHWYKADDLSTIVSVGNSYTPNDITSAGIYTYYVTQSDGTCEGVPAVATLNMFTTPLPKITGNMPVCENEQLILTADGEVLWYTDETLKHADAIAPVHFVSYAEAGTYNLYVTRQSEFCTSNPVSLTIQINAIPDEPTIQYENVCNGNDVIFTATGEDILWYKNGMVTETEDPSTLIEKTILPGTITVEATQTINGCTSPRASATAEIYAIPNKPTPNNVTICDYNEIEPVSVSVQANAEATWYSDESLTAILATSTSYKPSNKETKTFYVTQTINGCESEPVEVTLKVNAKPGDVVFKQTRDIEECEGTRVTITAESSNVIFWYEAGDDNPIFTGRTFTVPTTEVGEYTYYATQTDAAGCVSDMTPKKVKLIAGPTFALIEKQDTICEYDNPGRLIVSRQKENETVTWITPTGETIPGENSDTLDIPASLKLKPGIHTFKARTTVATCSFETRKETALRYVIHPKPADPKLTKTAFCYDGQPVTLSTNAQNPMWYSENYSILSAYAPEYATIYSEVGDYTIKMTQTINECTSDTVSIPFLISALPTPTITGADKVCEGANESYVVTKSDESNTMKWFVTGNRVIYELSSYSSGFVRSIDWTTEGLDTIFVYETNKYGCLGENEYPIEILSVPDAQFTAESLGQEGVITFTNTSDPQILNSKGVEKEYQVDYYWDFGRNTDTATVLQNAKVFEEKYRYGDYSAKMTAINEFGCANSVTNPFFVDVSHALYVPTAFAPMSVSGEIRVFKPKGFNCSTFKIWIYDAWNNLVYYSEGVDEHGGPICEWDGKVDGKIMQCGTYRYKIEVTFEDHSEDNLKITQSVKPIWGNVILTR
ncbi:MAG: hypothetical protein J6W37_10550 [Bacteroidales bacterium]|nr:hypothetical protein [Bacteroidales bacterium]